VTQPSQRPATYADILALPDNVTGEIVDGELVVSPRPAAPHAVTSSALGGTLVPPFQFGDGGPGGWWILDEPELHLGQEILVPDLGGWRKDRLPKLPEEPFFTLAPDWVCEVLSPTTSRFDRTKKLPAYARAALAHLWVLDPIAETLEAYRLEDARWTLLGTHGGDDLVRAEPFEGVEVRLGRIWGR
jgi:Uma2 family endonuclease